MVVTDELARVGSIGVLWAVVSGVRIGLPPIIHFGSESLKKRVVPQVLGGDKRICLCITERKRVGFPSFLYGVGTNCRVTSQQARGLTSLDC